MHSSSTGADSRLVAVAARHVVGDDLDDDVWDRVAGLARDAAVWRSRSSTSSETCLRDAVRRGTRELVLVSDGPKLLGFAALRAPGPDCAPHVEQVAVGATAPAGIVMTILLEAAFVVTRRACERAAEQRVAA